MGGEEHGGGLRRELERAREVGERRAKVDGFRTSSVEERGVVEGVNGSRKLLHWRAGERYDPLRR